MILYFKEELEDNAEFICWKKNNASETIVAVEDADMDKLAKTGYDNCILIAASNQSVQFAKDRHMAVLGFQAPESYMGSFLQVDYVIQGFEEIDMVFIDRVYRRHHGLPWTIAKTDRCLIRELTLEDMDALFELYSKPGITDYVEPLLEYQEELEYEKAYIRHMYGYYGYGTWLIFHKESGQLIGRAGLENKDYTNGGRTVTFSGQTELELGYIIAPEYQGQGYATEVCRAIIEFAINETEFDRINCLIDAENTASVNLAKKLGFSCVGASREKSYSGRKVFLDRYCLDISRE